MQRESTSCCFLVVDDLCWCAWGLVYYPSQPSGVLLLSVTTSRWAADCCGICWQHWSLGLFVIQYRMALHITITREVPAAFKVSESWHYHCVKGLLLCYLIINLIYQWDFKVRNFSAAIIMRECGSKPPAPCKIFSQQQNLKIEQVLTLCTRSFLPKMDSIKLCTGTTDTDRATNEPADWIS